MTTYIYAHDWEILRGERIKRWPSEDDVRTLTVSIDSWKGVSIEAKHFNVKVEEEKNQWWCEYENAWVELSCDSGAKGYSLRASVMTKEEAIKIAKHFVRLVIKTNPKQKYKVKNDLRL